MVKLTKSVELNVVFLSFFLTRCVFYVIVVIKLVRITSDSAFRKYKM